MQNLSSYTVILLILFCCVCMTTISIQLISRSYDWLSSKHQAYVVKHYLNLLQALLKIINGNKKHDINYLKYVYTLFLLTNSNSIIRQNRYFRNIFPLQYYTYSLFNTFKLLIRQKTYVFLVKVLSFIVTKLKEFKA